MNQLHEMTKNLEKATQEKIRELSKTERSFTEWYSFKSAVIETNITVIFDKINKINKTINIINKILLTISISTLLIGLEFIIHILRTI